MTTLIVENVPKDLIRGLRELANQNRRSLQDELLSILEDAAHRAPIMVAAAALAEAEHPNMPTEPRSVDIIRTDRDRDDHR